MDETAGQIVSRCELITVIQCSISVSLLHISKPPKDNDQQNNDHNFGLITHADILKMLVIVRADGFATADMSFTENKVRY